MMDDTPTDVDESRRAFLKSGAIATGGLALGLSANAASAQETTPTATPAESAGAGGGDARVHVSSYHPDAEFAVVSDAMEWTPQSVEGDYQTRMIRYLNTGEVVPIFVSTDAEIGTYEDSLGFVTADAEGGLGTTDGQSGLGGNESGNASGGGLFDGNETTTTTANETDATETASATTATGEPMPQVYRFESDASLTGDGIVSASFTTVDQSDASATLEGETWWQGEGGAEPANETETESVFGDDNATGNETEDGLLGDANETNETGNDSAGGGLFGGGNDSETATTTENDDGGFFSW